MSEKRFSKYVDENGNVCYKENGFNFDKNKMVEFNIRVEEKAGEQEKKDKIIKETEKQFLVRLTDNWGTREYRKSKEQVFLSKDELISKMISEAETSLESYNSRIIQTKERIEKLKNLLGK